MTGMQHHMRDKSPHARRPFRRVYSAAAPLLVPLLVLAVLLPPQRVLCGYSRGGTFLISGYGARSGGMGGATVASGGDESAVFWNPAFLACLETDRLGMSYVNLVPGTTARQSMFAYARSLKSMSSEDGEERVSSHAVGFLYSNLMLDLAGGSGYSENIFRFAYAYSPDYFISAGVAANLLIARSDFDAFDALGSAVDFALRLQLSRRTAFGFIARNAFSRVNYDDGYDQSLRRSYTAAISTRVRPDLLVESATEFAFGGLSRSTLGAEYALFRNRAYLRGGVSLLTSGENRTLPHFGIGFAFDRFSIDYNAQFDTEEAFEDTHRFSVGVRL